MSLLPVVSSPSRPSPSPPDKPSYTRTAVVFWDLDNKIPPPGVSLQSCLAALRAGLLKHCDTVEDVNLYANTRTLACARIFRKERNPSETPAPSLESPAAVGDVWEILPKACPICGSPMVGGPGKIKMKLRKHFQQHREQHQRRKMLRESVGGQMARGRMESLLLKEQMFESGDKVIASILEKLPGVRIRERTMSQMAERQITSLDGSRLTSVRPVPEAADKELVLDVEALMFCDRGRKGPGLICVVTDDRGFLPMIRRVKDFGWQTAVCAVDSAMFAGSDVDLNWDDIAVQAAVTPADSDSPPIFFNVPEMWGRT